MLTFEEETPGICNNNNNDNIDNNDNQNNNKTQLRA